MRARAATAGAATSQAAPAGSRLALATLCGVLFLTFLDTTIVSVSLANVQGTLHADVAELQWVVNGYALPFASLMLAFGSLGARLGRKKVLLSGLAVFSAGALLCALAPNPDTLIAGRALMGAGAAASEPGTLSMIRHLFLDEEDRAHALGAWAATSGLALALGPVIGGALVGFGGFRAVFWFSVGAGLVALAAAARQLPEVRGLARGHYDFGGLATVTLALAALTVGVILGESNGYRANVVIALLALGVAAAFGFLVAERYATDPLLDLAYLRAWPFSGALIVAFALFFGIFSIFFFTALYLQVVVGLSAYMTSAEFAAMTVALLIGSAAGGFLVPVSGPRPLMSLGCLLAGGGMFATDAVLAGGHPNEAVLAAALALGGLGFGLAVVPVTSVALQTVPAEHSGMAASATNTSRELGAVMGVAVLGALVNAHLTTGLAQRLHALGIPNVFQAIVVRAVETGEVPRSAPGAAAKYGAIVNRVIRAAYGAFQDGLHVSLVVAGIAILLGAFVALVTLAPRREPSQKDVPLGAKR
jgi:MFS family permease